MANKGWGDLSLYPLGDEIGEGLRLNGQPGEIGDVEPH
jgi:hypothetical protein